MYLPIEVLLIIFKSLDFFSRNTFIKKYCTRISKWKKAIVHYFFIIRVLLLLI